MGFLYNTGIMQRRIFSFIKGKIPRISSTELIALRSGNTSLDRMILKGKMYYPEKRMHKPTNFDMKKIDELFDIFDYSRVYPNDNKNKYIDFLAKNRFFSFLIEEKYGGYKLSTHEMSDILTRITSFDPALGVVTMVPNSLGPGELITLYGTQQQKDNYLPKLANGTYIPCFGLTGPQNGSDATGAIDTGKLVVDNDGKKYIEVTVNKRYITLAPVANLIGLAFDLQDPDKLLERGTPGITVALIEKGSCGLLQNTYHNPLNVGFPNGTLKGNLRIPVENIIGGESNAGEGWKMLMECLAAGRGISLPATANASSKVAAFGIHHYIQIRKQFKMSLSKMEAIQQKYNNLLYNTWIIQSSVELTNTILDNGDKPAVLSAIMKQQTTERARIVLNEAMDIHAGASICLGYSNFLEKFYRCAPVGITVEGSNTLTRSLIIFGQGLNKSHPHIFEILDSILKNDETLFDKHFKEILNHSIRLYADSCANIFRNDLQQQIIHFACLTNFVALRGGALKKEQLLSGKMADIFSNLYMAISVQHYQNTYQASEKFTKYVIDRLLNENRGFINEVVDNLGVERFTLCHLKRNVRSFKYDEEREIFKELMENPKILTEIKKNIEIRGVLKCMEEAVNLDISSDEYKALEEKIINVGEYTLSDL